jgi:hypothetical protein
MNEIIQACRSRSYPRLKARWTNDIVWMIKASSPPKGLTRVRCEFEWVHPNKRHDPDNQEAAQKFIWDSLSAPRGGKPGAGVIPGDGWAQNAGSSHTHRIGDKPGVWVTVVPVSER